MRLSHLAEPGHFERPRLFAQFQAWFRAAAAERRAARAARRQLSHELQQLARFSDGELRDIGLVRADFLSVAAGTFSRD